MLTSLSQEQGMDDDFEKFWEDVKAFSHQQLTIIVESSAPDSPEARKCVEWIEAGTVVTIKTLREYTEHKGYLNHVDNMETYNLAYDISHLKE